MGSGLYGKVAGDRGRNVVTRQGTKMMTASINSDDVEVRLRVRRTGISTEDGTIEVEVSLVPLGMGWIPSATPTPVMVGVAKVVDGELTYQSTRSVPSESTMEIVDAGRKASIRPKWKGNTAV